MDTLGYFVSIFIGISLGLIGGGGSILTLPVLVYLFGVNPVLATAYSLFIVGTTSLFGTFSNFKKGLVSIKTALVFGIPSIISVFLTRTYVLPAIPEAVLSIGNFTLTKNIFLLLLFAVLMILASYSMIKKSKAASEETSQKPFNYPLVFAQGIFIGLITGLIGSGGGFLIIPALVNLLRLPMKTAVGTSLLIISLNSLAGFLFSLHDTAIDWIFLLKITGFAIAGIFIGMALSKKIKAERLKLGFGWFVLAMGLYILIKETLLH